MPATVSPPRALRLRVILPAPHNAELMLEPPGLDAVAECLRLDPKKDAPPESDPERLVRLQRQSKLLLGREYGDLTAKLSPVQVGEIVMAIYLALIGIDPADFLAVQEHRRKLAECQRNSDELAREIEELTVALAAELKITPAAAGQIPLADALALQKRLHEAAMQAAKFEAGIHGVKLQ